MDTEQRRLGLSLATNVLTRVPGIVGVLVFLPWIKASIGTDAFSVLMAAIALGGSVSFVMGGFALIGRRLMGEAVAARDPEREAGVFRSLWDVSLWGLAACAVLVIGYAAFRQSAPVFYAVALLTSFSTLTTQADNVRAAYNEHYVTATALIISQTLIYVVAFLLPLSAWSIALGAAVILGPQIVASLYTGIALVHSRRYLLRGKPDDRRAIASQGVLLGFGEGLLMSALGFVVVYLEMDATAAQSAWYATTLRLFVTVLTPVVLILVPVSSYVRLIWASCTISQQRKLVLGTLVISAAYSLVVGAVLLVLSRLYVGGVLHLPEPGGPSFVLPVFAAFTAVIVLKSYTSIALVVLDSKRLSTEIAVMTLATLVAAAVAASTLGPIATVACWSVLLTVGIIVLIANDVLRFLRVTR